MLQALPGHWELQSQMPGRGQDSAEFIFLLQPVTRWTVTFALGWTCRPAGHQKSFWLVIVDEPSALTSSGLATTAASATLPLL